MEELIKQPGFGSLNIPLTLEQVCDPEHTALLVYDMQVGIVSQIKDKEQVVKGVLQVLDAARKAGVRIYFSRHLSLPKELMGISQFRMAMQWQKVDSADKVKPWFLRGTPAFELMPELDPLPTEAIFDKITMSAFEGTFLNIALRDAQTNAFIIIGAATEVGIEPTVRHASDLGYIPVMVTDACGSGNKQAAERALSSLAFAGNALQTNVETICSVLAPVALSKPL